MTLSINSQFDSGNIEVVEATDPASIRLKIRKDSESEFLQWFHFSVSGLRGQGCRINIINAGQSTYPTGWEGYDVATSVDRQYWYRTPAEFDGQQLSWTVDAHSEIIWFAYFTPYSMDQHADLIAAAATAEAVEYESLGVTHQGRSIDYLKVTALPAEAANDRFNRQRRQLWVIGRQHPGESMTEWWMEGWLDRLLDPDDATSRALRGLADIHIVPNMNPDGSALGNLRSNALGVNLNREWASPSVEKSPEVYYVRQRMEGTGVDMSLDVHGDEALPYNFIAGTEGIAGWTAERDATLVALKQTWAALNPDFQHAHGYPRNEPGKANLAMCSNNLAHSFGALAMTLEMPFKDTLDTPRPAGGWSAERSMRLGGSFVDVAHLALTDRLLR
ncbi:MAG: carboxypeptidase family protein [Granulosicoccus sp.]|nr:carboxypeptidase family protein [Granulosicoccus sp.]